MTTLHTLVGAALAAVCIFPLAQDRAAAPAKPTVAAVVDISKAIEQSPRWNKLAAQLKELQARANARMEELTKGIDEIKATSQSTGADTLERKQADFQMQSALAGREFEAKMWNDRIDIETARAHLVCYEDVSAAIAKLAKARGIQIVHRMFEPDEAKGDPLTMPARDVVMRSRVFDRRQVWYVAPEIDLTADVIKELQVALPADKADRNGGPSETGGSPKPEAPKPEPGRTDPKGGG